MHEIGYIPDDVAVEHQDNVCVSTQLFEKLATRVLFPHMEDMPQQIEHGSWEILLPNGRSRYHLDDCFDMCHEVGFALILSPANFSYLSQPLEAFQYTQINDSPSPSSKLYECPDGQDHNNSLGLAARCHATECNQRIPADRTVCELG
jgi:hypothetical protein